MRHRVTGHQPDFLYWKIMVYDPEGNATYTVQKLPEKKWVFF